ncbi:MAG: hypothetical protein N3F63_05275 [Thermoplasmata archaeon]|nr:hypothetical protein [Thermoplasmata archaeon]
MNKKMLIMFAGVAGCAVILLTGSLYYLSGMSLQSHDNRKIYNTELSKTGEASSPYLYKGPVAFDSALAPLLENWQYTRDFFGVILPLNTSSASFETDAIAIAKSLGISGKMEKHMEGYAVRDQKTEESLVYIMGPKVGGISSGETASYCVYLRYETNYSTEPALGSNFLSDDKVADIAQNFASNFISIAWKHAKPHVTLKLSSIDADIVSNGSATYITTKVVSYRVSYDDHDTGAPIMLRVNSTGRVVWMNAFADFLMTDLGVLDAQTPNKILTYLTNNGVGTSKPPSLVKSATITNISIYYATSPNNGAFGDKDLFAVAVPVYELKITVAYKDNTSEVVSQNLKVMVI